MIDAQKGQHDEDAIASDPEFRTKQANTTHHLAIHVPIAGTKQLSRFARIKFVCVNGGLIKMCGGPKVKVYENEKHI